MLTQEDWNEVLYNGMDRTSSWAALYFIALMTFGNYVLFNLLVAILVEGFSTEVNRLLINLFIQIKYLKPILIKRMSQRNRSPSESLRTPSMRSEMKNSGVGKPQTAAIRETINTWPSLTIPSHYAFQVRFKF